MAMLLGKGIHSLAKLPDFFIRPLGVLTQQLLVHNSVKSSGSKHQLLTPFLIPSGCHSFHTCSVLHKDDGLLREPKIWTSLNNVVYPPREEGEPPRPAEVNHMRANIKCGYKKMWYVAAMIRGMSIDEAYKQLSFNKTQVSRVIMEVLQEAQEMAIRDQNVEYRSNLWIADSFIGKGRYIKGLRKHARGRYGVIHYQYNHYFVRLREGRPPKHYYPAERPGHQKLKEYIEEQRSRLIKYSL